MVDAPRNSSEMLPTGLTASPEISMDELELASRDHALPLEALRYPITPIGLHYLLIHFDIPDVDVSRWRLMVEGRVRRTLELSLEDLQSRPAVTLPVTMECAGNGRARLQPRWLSQPWLDTGVGTAEWMGTPLRGVLDEAGLLEDAREVVFTGLDRGIQSEVEHQYERSLTIQEAAREDVLLAYAMNDQPLPPQHGYPVRLLVPGWYGMTSVKWLSSIRAVREPFQGFQQAVAYHVRRSEDDGGVPVTRMKPRALMIPPGVPDFLTRKRFVPARPCVLEGRAWSGFARITRVEVSTDGGCEWADAQLGSQPGPYAWRSWTFQWTPEIGENDLCVRATDGTGEVQPDEPAWNLEGVGNNLVQRVPVVVR